MMKTPRLARWLLGQIRKRMGDRKPDFIIGNPEDPYLVRWWIAKNIFFSIYFHVILKDDDDRALHDHPWPSLSLCLDGTVGEYYANPTSKQFNGKDLQVFYRSHNQGDWVYRPATLAHRLIVFQGIGAITLFMTGPRIRKWGFWCPHSWRFWRDFVDGTNKGQVGRGCE